MSTVDHPGEVFLCKICISMDMVLAWILGSRWAQLRFRLTRSSTSECLNRSMQDMLRDFALMQIQKQRFCCRLVRSLMDEHGIEQDPELVSLVFATPVITAAMQSPALLVRLICFISPARRSVNWLLRNRLISSTLTAAALRLPPRWADRISIFQSLHPSMHQP